MKITIRWFDGMKRTHNVVDKQICSDNICLTFENGDELWIPNKGVRYVRIPAQKEESEISQTREFGRPITCCERASIKLKRFEDIFKDSRDHGMYSMTIGEVMNYIGADKMRRECVEGTLNHMSDVCILKRGLLTNDAGTHALYSLAK